MRTIAFALVAILSTAALVRAQSATPDTVPPDVRARGRRLQDEAAAHVRAERWALAAETYQQIYDLSRQYGVAQAPVALWDVGLALMHIPGREAEARDAFQRFLDESTTLTEEAQIRDWRSTALEHIAELDARLRDDSGGSGSAAALSAPVSDSGEVWAIVPVGVGAAPDGVRDVVRSAGAELEHDGARVLSDAQLGRRVENTLSQAFTAPPAEQLARLDQAEQDLAVAVARHRWTDVLSGTESLFRELRPSLAGIRAEDARADLSNLCGYRVLAAEQADSAGATAARACFGLIPHFAPDRGLHPPEVLELVAAAGRQLPTALVVEAAPDDPAGCPIYVNGVQVGETPRARVAVPPGSYAVQVECGDQPARVHAVQVTEADAGDVPVPVRASLDTALRAPASLVYPTASLAGLPGDLGTLGRGVGAARVLAVLEQPSGPLLRAYAIHAEGPARLLGESQLGRGADDPEIRGAVAQFGHAREGSGDGRGREAPPPSESISPWGPVLLGVGVAALAVGAVLGVLAAVDDHALNERCGGPPCPDTAENHSTYNEMWSYAAASDVFLVVGGLAAITGLILTLTLHESSAADTAGTQARVVVRPGQIALEGSF